MEDREIERTKSNIAALLQLLEKEFEALKGQNFDVFEQSKIFFETFLKSKLHLHSRQHRSYLLNI